MGDPIPVLSLGRASQARKSRAASHSTITPKSTGDAAVQQTNLDAAVAKSSAVAMGYFDDHLLPVVMQAKSDVPKPPIINRGYYARVFSVARTVNQFIGVGAMKPPLMESRERSGSVSGGSSGSDHRSLSPIAHRTGRRESASSETPMSSFRARARSRSYSSSGGGGLFARRGSVGPAVVSSPLRIPVAAGGSSGGVVGSPFGSVGAMPMAIPGSPMKETSGFPISSSPRMPTTPMNMQQPGGMGIMGSLGVAGSLPRGGSLFGAGVPPSSTHSSPMVPAISPGVHPIAAAAAAAAARAKIPVETFCAHQPLQNENKTARHVAVAAHAAAVAAGHISSRSGGSSRASSPLVSLGSGTSSPLSSSRRGSAPAFGGNPLSLRATVAANVSNSSGGGIGCVAPPCGESGLAAALGSPQRGLSPRRSSLPVIPQMRRRMSLALESSAGPPICPRARDPLFLSMESAFCKKSSREAMRRVGDSGVARVLAEANSASTGENTNETIHSLQVVSLGAGSDTLGVRTIQGLRVGGEVKWVDVDHPTVIGEKLRALSAAIPGGAPDSYSAVAADLRDPESVISALSKAGLSREAPTLFLAECVFMYMPIEATSGLLSALTSHFSGDIAMMRYDPFAPANDPFSQTMAANLKNRGCDPAGVTAAVSPKAMEAMCVDCGFKTTESANMLTVYNRTIPEHEKNRVSSLEWMDEVEEWELLLSHYTLILATRPAIGSSEDGPEISSMSLMTAK